MSDDATIRKYECGTCYCTFYMHEGIEPGFCPSCAAEFNDTVLVIDTGETGEYEAGAA